MGRRTAQDWDDETPVAGGGLLGRRALLKAVGLLGTLMASAGLADSSLRNNPDRPTSMRALGRAMSYEQPGSLADDEVYALAAYLLAENGITEVGSLLDAVTLPMGVMPNRGRFPVPEN